MELQGYTVKSMITFAFDISTDALLAGVTKAIDSTRFDVIGKRCLEAADCPLGRRTVSVYSATPSPSRVPHARQKRSSLGIIAPQLEQVALPPFGAALEVSDCMG